ncbi:hypothetical protein GQ55_6G278800 [Panicum hallii var. hallii]|uniref:Uncharacterized protein n=1 Tax=Panicum hallii var. hallii TaxID=1504633 RepID=A0A2T7DAE4_9POAL|nr:hypothetical protein GQ55_6G278800 [Panicum hallii var. hallii]
MVGNGSAPPGSRPAHAPQLATGEWHQASLGRQLLGGGDPHDPWPPAGMAALGSRIREVSPARCRLSPPSEGEGECEIQIRGPNPRLAQASYREFRAAGESARRHDVHSSYATAASCRLSGGAGPLDGSIVATCARATTPSLPPPPPRRAAAGEALDPACSQAFASPSSSSPLLQPFDPARCHARDLLVQRSILHWIAGLQSVYCTSFQ